MRLAERQSTILPRVELGQFSEMKALVPTGPYPSFSKQPNGPGEIQFHKHPLDQLADNITAAVRWSGTRRRLGKKTKAFLWGSSITGMVLFTCDYKNTSTPTPSTPTPSITCRNEVEYEITSPTGNQIIGGLDKQECTSPSGNDYFQVNLMKPKTNGSGFDIIKDIYIIVDKNPSANPPKIHESLPASPIGCVKIDFDLNIQSGQISNINSTGCK